jgi:hypothetical protein
MSPKEILQIAGSELDRLAQQLAGCNSATAKPLATIESLTDKFVALRQDLPSLEAAELREGLQSILTKAKRVQTLLEAGTVFHCQSIFGRFGRAEAPDTYGSDGTFSSSHGSRIIFEG